MGKFSTIKIKYIIFFLIANHCVFSQHKIVVPKFGTIVFNKETIVIDEIAFNKTLKEYKPKLIKELSDQVILNQLLLHKKIDSVSYKKSIKTIEQNFMPLFEFFILENEKLKIVNVYNKDTIHSHKYENGNKISTIFFDKKTNAIYNNYNQKEITYFYNEDITEFKEFKNQRKNIKGFDCFKVSYIFTEEAEDDYPYKFIKYYRELWVTDKIKLPFISMIKNKELFQNYFPLEINENILGIEGLLTTYILESIDLK